MKFFNPKPQKWYIVAVVKGHRYADGPYVSEKIARETAWKSLSGVVFDVVPSDQMNKAKFYQTCKHDIWENTGDFEDAVQRMKHTLSEKEKKELEQSGEHKL